MEWTQMLAIGIQLVDAAQRMASAEGLSPVQFELRVAEARREMETQITEDELAEARRFDGNLL